MSAASIGQGCTCTLCKQSHAIPKNPVIPGTPEHLIWLTRQELKRQESDKRFLETRPPLMVVNPSGIRKPT